MKPQGMVPVLALGMLFGSVSIASAQFHDAVFPETIVGVTPVTAVNTGNYIYDVGGTSYIANVWDDNGGPNAKLSWQVGASSGFVTIDASAHVVDPDVCILKNAGGVIYAIVAYYDANVSQFKIRSFQWQTGSQQFTGGNIDILGSGNFESAINIDAGDMGDFVIVWDQPGQLIQMSIGHAPGWSVPQLVFPGGPFNIEPGTMPDVCFFRNSSNNEKQVDVVYKNTGGFIAVDFYRHSELVNGIVNYDPAFRSPAADLTYRFPRIDCPAPGFGLSGDFTLVVEDSDNNSTWYVKGFNKHNCCVGYTSHIYNDGTTANSPYNITDVPNERPVVSYHNNGDAITVAWNIDNSFGLLSAPGATMGKYPVALSCDKKANIHSAAKYLYVPTGVSFGTTVSRIAVSGKYSTNELYTYYNESNSTIYYKSLPHVTNAPSLRETETTDFYNWMNNLETSGSADPILELNVWDITGRLVLQFKGNVANLKQQWHDFTDRNKTGIYAVQTFSLDHDNSFKGKVIITNK